MNELQYLKNLISFNRSGYSAFPDFLLSQTVEYTKADTGLLCILKDSPEKGYKYLETVTGETVPLKVLDRIVGNHKALVNEALDKRRIMVIDQEIPELKSSGFSNETGQVRKSCIIPLKSDMKIEGFMIIVRMENDNGAGIYNIIESLIEPLTILTLRHFEREQYIRTVNAAEEKSKRNSLYLSGFTHEIRTPMNALAGFSQLLKEPDLKQENLKKYLDIINLSSEEMISFINSFTEISEIETGEARIYSGRIHLFELFEEIFSDFNKKIREKGLKFERIINITRDDEFILTDGAKLKRILSGLLSNSLNYTYTGKISISCFRMGDDLKFIVSDTGRGVSKDEQKAIFKSPWLENSLLKESKGSGLSLVIIRSYIEMMNGKIGFESVEGKGTDFWFTIPFKTAVVQMPGIEKVMTQVYSSPTIKKILVAEDNNMNYFLIKSFLSDLNVDVIRAMNGKEAVDIFKSEVIDLILMDIKMPEMDGYTATRIIKEINPEARIIAQTAYSNDRSLALANGCDDFITKPFRKEKLLSLVSMFI